MNDPSAIDYVDTDFLINKFLEVEKKMVASSNGKPHMHYLDSGIDDTVIRIPKRNFSDGIPTFDQTLNDYASGILCLAGRANAGKSTAFVSTMTGVLENNPDAIVLDFSFDDPPRKRLQQIVANISGLRFIDIAQVSNLKSVKAGMYEEARGKFFNWISSGRLVPLSHVENVPNKARVNVRDFNVIIRKMKTYRASFPNKKLVFFVDGWNNLDTGSLKGYSELQLYNEMLKRLQAASEEFEVKLWLSSHLRKSLEKRPSVQDIKGTSNMEFDAVSIMIARNEYRENSLSDPLMWEDEAGDLHPILTLEVHKTKVSEWDYPLFMILNSGSCRMTPIPPVSYTSYYELWKGRKSK